MIAWWAFVLVLAGTFCGAIGSLLLKRGAHGSSLKQSLFSKILWFGLFFYGFGALIQIVAYKGGDLIIIYPMSSLAYIWSLLLAAKFLKERIYLVKIIGIILIMSGVVCLVL